MVWTWEWINNWILGQHGRRTNQGTIDVTESVWTKLSQPHQRIWEAHQWGHQSMEASASGHEAPTDSQRLQWTHPGFIILPDGPWHRRERITTENVWWLEPSTEPTASHIRSHVWGDRRWKKACQDDWWTTSTTSSTYNWSKIAWKRRK